MKSFLASATGLLALCVLTTLPTMAQPTTGGPSPGTTPVDTPTETPIDGGASLLLAGGVAFGLKQLRDRRLARQATR